MLVLMCCVWLERLQVMVSNVDGKELLQFVNRTTVQSLARPGGASQKGGFSKAAAKKAILARKMAERRAREQARKASTARGGGQERVLCFVQQLGGGKGKGGDEGEGGRRGQRESGGGKRRG